jgi:hypothetical protein
MKYIPTKHPVGYKTNSFHAYMTSCMTKTEHLRNPVCKELTSVSFNVLDSKMANTTSFFEYQTTDDLDRYNIEHVILWLHVKGNVGSYRVYEKMSSLPRRMIFMGKYEKDALEWKKITFTPNKLWLENPLRKLRIEVKGLKESVSNKPMLQVDFKQKKKRLTKRHAVQTTYTPATATVDCPPNKKNLCCRHNRVIQLKKHYDWILYPKSYRAYTCAGDCNLLSYRKNSTWSLLAHAMNPQRTPCCIPTAFESLSVIARASSSSSTKIKFANVKKVTLKDVVVKSCGCSWTLTLCWRHQTNLYIRGTIDD